jgi:hypothetical protein
MGFLNPLWLLLAAAVAVPLIIHLLQRHQGPRVIFPAVRYLLRAEREHARQIKLRQLLLLMLRLAIVMFIAFAAARPFLRGAGVGHEPTAVVIVLDNSMSSGLVAGDRRVLDELKDRALETLTRAGPDDRFWLLRAGAPWEPALPGDATTTAQRVRETQPTAAAADIIAAVTRARSILTQGADARAREIQVLSDLQDNNVRGSLNTARGSEPALLLWGPKRSTQPNASVDAVTLGSGLAPRAGERSTIVAQIGGTARDSVNVRLSVGGRIAGAAVTQPGSSAVIPFPARNAGTVSGEVQIDADALRADDRRYFIAAIQPAPRVLLTKTTPFVSEALAVLSDAGRITQGFNSEVVVAPGGLNAQAAGATASLIVLPPETPLELPAANRRLASTGINWRYEQRPAGGELRFKVNANADGLLRGLAGVRVLQSYRLVPIGNTRTDSVMLQLEDGSPWAVRGARARGGRFVLFASPFNAESSTLPTSSAMIPLLDRAIGPWSSSTASNTEYQPGQRPDANEPGIYESFVVNPAPIESDLRYADAGRVERALEPLRVKRVRDSSAWQRGVYAHRVGREIWRFVLFALLALLIVEALAAATGTKVHAPAAD